MKRTFLYLALSLAGLCGLFWLLAFAPDESRSQPAPLEISVILREPESAASTLRQGMEQAAVDLNVELRFLTPSTDNSAEEQARLLEREVEASAAAVLLIPADRTELAAAVSAAAEKTAIVTLETDMREQGARTSVRVDHAALGEALGRAAINGIPPGGTALLLDSVPGNNGIRERLETAKAVLQAEGRTVRVCQWTADGEALQAALRAEPVDAVIAFEAAALESVAALERDDSGSPLLYGAGSTAAIAAGLERSRITAIAAENVFSAGYLAVEAAASAARREPLKDIPPISFSMIRQETMYESGNQKLLFPVT